jgi:hypothetical protein
MEAGLCIRSALPIRLNESPSEYFAAISKLRLTMVDHSQNGLDRLKEILLPNAATPMDQAERDRTWWHVLRDQLSGMS